MTLYQPIAAWHSTAGFKQWKSVHPYQEVLVLASRKGFPNSLIGLSTGWWTHASYFSPRWPTCQARGFCQSTKSYRVTTRDSTVNVLYVRAVPSAPTSATSCRWQQKVETAICMDQTGRSCWTALCFNFVFDCYTAESKDQRLKCLYKRFTIATCSSCQMWEDACEKSLTGLWSVLWYQQTGSGWTGWKIIGGHYKSDSPRVEYLVSRFIISLRDGDTEKQIAVWALMTQEIQWWSLLLHCVWHSWSPLNKLTAAHSAASANNGG